MELPIAIQRSPRKLPAPPVQHGHVPWTRTANVATIATMRSAQQVFAHGQAAPPADPVGRRGEMVRLLGTIGRTIADPLLDLLLPPRCPSCQRRCETARFFCPDCARRITPLSPPLCLRCGAPFTSPPDHLCEKCLRRPPHFTRARAAAHYRTHSRTHSADPLAAVIGRFKYGPDPTLAPILIEVLCRNLPLAIDHEVLVPVPLHIDRLRWRGFNQAALLARALARRSGIPCDPKLLRRQRPTPPQVGLGEGERRRNIRGAFTVRRPEAVADRTVLLIDDVYTTGATANECARTLRHEGARRVDVLVVARAI